MIRKFNRETNNFDVFFEQFETVVDTGITHARWKPNDVLGGVRFIEPPTVVTLPYGSLDVGSVCEHEYARGLIEHAGKIWSCRVCRHCAHVAPPERGLSREVTMFMEEWIGLAAIGTTPTLPT